MSAPEHNGDVEVGQKGSVEVTRNAQGRPQFRVKVYVGDDPRDINSARDVAVSVYRELEREFGPTAVQR